MASLNQHTPKALSDSNLGHPEDHIQCTSAETPKFESRKGCSSNTGKEIGLQSKIEEQRPEKNGHSTDTYTELARLKDRSKLKKLGEEGNHSAIDRIDDKVDIRAIEGPVFVYKTVADVLSEIQSTKNKVPVVSLIDIRKIEHLTMLKGAKGVADKVLNEHAAAPKNSGMAKGSAKKDLPRSPKKQKTLRNNESVEGVNSEIGDVGKMVKRKVTRISGKKSLGDIESKAALSDKSPEKIQDKTPEKTHKPRGRKPQSSPDSTKITGDKDVKKSPKAKLDKSPEIVVTPPKSKRKPSPKSSPSPRRKADLSPKKKEVATAKGSPKEKKRAASTSPNSKSRSPSKGTSPCQRKKSPGSSSNSTASLHLEIPEPDLGLSAKRTRSPSARFKEDIILYPWDTTRKSPKKSPVDKTAENSDAQSESLSKVKKGAKSPNDNSQTMETGKKTPSPRRKHSPKKEQSEPKSSEKFEPTPGPSGAQLQQVSRSLTFDSDIEKKEGISSAIPKDFKYKYQSSDSTKQLGLSDLITKVNSAIESSDEKLKLLFGEAEEQDYNEDTEPYTSSGDSSNSNDDSIDSDKTVTEFNNSFNLEDKVEETQSTDGETVEKEKQQKEQTSSSDIEKTDKDKNSEELEDDKGKLIQGGSDEPSKMNDDDCDSDINKAAVTEHMDSKSDNEDSGSDSSVVNSSTEKSQTEDTENKTFTGNHLNKNNNCSSDSEYKGENKTTIENNAEIEVHKEKSVFDMFGLKLKRKSVTLNHPKVDQEVEMKSDSNIVDGNKQNKNVSSKKSEAVRNTPQDSDDDVMIVGETNPNKVVIVLSDDEAAGKAESVSKRKETKPKFVSVNKCVDPKPLDILAKLEKKNVNDKSSPFLSQKLEEYIAVNKENVVPSLYEDSKAGVVDSAADMKRMLENPYPDFDEVDDMMYISFSCKQALHAHVRLEQKVAWLNEVSLRKLGHLKAMKERQNDAGARRLTDVKFALEQKHNYRGIPMRLIKYNKMLKQELEAILYGYEDSADLPFLKTPEKTSDITKIKGWKNKFKNVEEMQAAAGLQLSESGKLHWKTEERLLKKLDPDDVKDIGIDLKKKRRKLVNFTKKKGSYKYDTNDSPVKSESEDEFEGFDLEVGAITEADVYNEDEDKPPLDKIPYKDKYLSQHKYGARKFFVRKMGLDSKDELILKKLGTQKTVTKENEDPIKDVGKMKRKSWFTLHKLTQSMAIAASSALDKKLLNRAKALSKNGPVGDRRSMRRSAGRAKPMVQTEVSEPEDDTEEMMEEAGREGCDIEQEAEVKAEPAEEGSESGSDSEDEGAEGYEEVDPEAEAYGYGGESEARAGRMKMRNRSSRRASMEQLEQEESKLGDKKKIVRKENCDQPGCRYGCICHLCKLSDSGEEKEADVKPPCDKEYCKLGCICDSIETQMESKSHCRKPACMFECKCPPKQPKPDIPKERDGHKLKKKRVRKGKKGQTSSEIKDEEASSPKEEAIVNFDDAEDWEPPSKRKRSSNNSRFANLPRRESTYRLAKNLDAVSRKAMEVYATSEMYAEQRIRRRKSDPVYDFLDTDVSKTSSKMGNEHKVFEISDDDTDGEMFPADLVSCQRTTVFEGLQLKRRSFRRECQQNTANTSSAPVVIDLIDSDTEDNSTRASSQPDKSGLPCSSGHSHSRAAKKTVTEKMGLARKHGDDNSKWKTQMVCLKAKKKSDEKGSGGHSEIKLLEIISNCNWENDRTNMLSKISHIISKGKDGPLNNVIMWQNYILHFLPRANKPAVIPPELQSKLPNSMYSIRVRVTQNINDAEKAESDQKVEEIVDEAENTDEKAKELSEDERKQQNVKLQKKLIDKIKFAEKLRDLIIAEEKKGSDASKFSVSLDGIQKALKKYKTQLWKAYTGSNNMTLMQLKKAVAAAKSGKAGAPDFPDFAAATAMSEGQAAEASGDTMLAPNIGFHQKDMSATLARIHANQGLKIVCPQTRGGFIPLGNMAQPVTNTVNTNVNPNTHTNLIVMPQTQLAQVTTGNIPITAKQQTLPNVSSISGAQSSASTSQRKASKNHLPLSPGVVNSKLDSRTSGSSPATGSSDVLLIPVPDSRASNWDPNSNPVLSGKMTMLPNGNATPVTVQNGTSVISMFPTTGTQSMRFPGPGGITNLVPCQTLNGQPVFIQSSQPGKILINAIQPVSSGSSVFNPMQMTGQPVTIPGQTKVSGSNSAVSKMSSAVVKQVIPLGGLPTSMCSVYPIRLAPVNTSISTANSLPSASTYSPVQGTVPSCFGRIPVQVRPIKNTNKSYTPPVVPVTSGESQSAQNPKSVNDTAPVAAGSPVIVTSQSNLSNVQSKKDTTNLSLNQKTDKTEVTENNQNHNEAKVPDTVVESEDELKFESSGIDDNDDKVKEEKADEQGASDSVKEVEDTTDINEIVNTAKKAGIEIANAISLVDTSEHVNKPEGAVGVDLKKEITTDEESDSCLIVDESKQAVAAGDDLSKALEERQALLEHRKRKTLASATEADGDIPAKKPCTGIVSPGAMPVIFLTGTEEMEDIDVMSFDTDETDVMRPAPTNRRKSQLKSTMQPDGFEIERVKVKRTAEEYAKHVKQKTEENVQQVKMAAVETSDSSKADERRQKKPEQERNRRKELQGLFRYLSNVVLKYNPKLLSFTTGIPHAMILQETLNLIGALQHKMQGLQECVEDGKQYQNSLELSLQQHIDSFVRSGVPENIIRNFLKSVASATASSGATVTPEPGATPDPTAEASDVDLDYQRITTADVVKTAGKQTWESYSPPTLIKVEFPTILKMGKSPLYKQSLLNQAVIADMQSNQPLEADGNMADCPSINSNADSELGLAEGKVEMDVSDINSVISSDLQGDLAEASDDDEVRSSTGYDSVLDDDIDFTESEEISDKTSEGPAQGVEEGESSMKTEPYTK